LGLAALIVFLSSLLVGILSLVVLAWSALGVWRTVRYGYKDFRAWSEFFRGYLEDLQAVSGAMQERARSISSHAAAVREGVDDIQDTLEELRDHPLLRASRFAARFRRQAFRA